MIGWCGEIIQLSTSQNDGGRGEGLYGTRGGEGGWRDDISHRCLLAVDLCILM